MMNLFNPITNIWNTVGETVDRLVNTFIIQPIVGLVEVAAGLVFTVPVMVTAGCQAVWKQVPRKSHGQVQMGADLLQDGWVRLDWPVMSVAFLTGCGWVGVVPMLTIVTCVLAVSG